MKTNERHGVDPNQPDLNQDTTEQAPSVNAARRRFTQSGLAVSGVLLTLASRSALGGNLLCKSPSGFLSGNASAHGTPVTCAGRSPGYWGTHPVQWPMPYQPGKCTSGQSHSKSESLSKEKTRPEEESHSSSCTNSSDWSGGTAFRSVFRCSGRGVIYAQYSMMQVFWLTENKDPQQLGAHIVAAILNARMGGTPVLTENQVVNIFNEWDSKGYFEPTAGVKWYAADIVAYLQSTMV